MSVITAATTAVEDVASVGTTIAAKGVSLYYKLLAYFAGAVILIGIGAVPSWYYTRQYEVNFYTAQIESANTAAANKITKLTEAKAKVDLELQEKKDEIQTKFIAGKQADADTIAKLRATNSRLWLQIANTSGRSSGTVDSGSTVGTTGTSPTPVLLPQSTSDDLLNLAQRADSVSEQLRACESWATAAKAALDKWKKDNNIK